MEAQAEDVLVPRQEQAEARCTLPVPGPVDSILLVAVALEVV